MKRINNMIFLALVAAAFLGTVSAQAQNSIQSQEDYQKVSQSIVSISQRLYQYAQQYPSYAFTPTYSTTGEVIAMDVTGVSSARDAKLIGEYLLELELLGDQVRAMNVAHLPASKDNAAKSRLTEKEALRYTPTIAHNNELLSSTKKK